MEKITLQEARRLALFAQDLWMLPKKEAVKEDVKHTISKLGVLQIDTINIVARSPYFSMWSRLGEYDTDWINQQLAEQGIFECWAHVASFLPIEDFPLHRRLVLEKLRLPWYQHWYDEHQAEADAILKHIKDNGAVRSFDFKRPEGQKGGTWWDWKIEKRALEYWFTSGELMISKRINFQRVYDLTGRVMPDWKDSDAPDLDKVYRELTLKSISAMGFALPGWLPDYFRLPKPETQLALQKLIDQKKLIDIQVDSWEEAGWALPEVWEAFQSSKRKHTFPQFTTLLTPFDSLIWDRKRTRKLFDFDYSIECYLPAAKRKYGYFVLPILHNDQLVGRLDAKAHRKEGIFEVLSLYLEPAVSPDQELVESLASALTACARWHQSPAVKLAGCDSKPLLKLLEPLIHAGV